MTKLAFHSLVSGNSENTKLEFLQIKDFALSQLIDVWANLSIVNLSSCQLVPASAVQTQFEFGFGL